MEMRKNTFLTATKVVGIMMMMALLILVPARKVHAGDYSLWVNGVQVTDLNKNNVLGDELPKLPTVVFDSSTNTLTLNDALITKSVDLTMGRPMKIICGIYSGLTEKLTITGSAKITGSDTGIRHSSDGELVVVGTGSGIVIDASTYGILKTGSNAMILGGKIVARCEDGNAQFGDPQAIKAADEIVIRPDADITAVGYSQSAAAGGYYQGFGIANLKGLITINGGKVVAKGSGVGISNYDRNFMVDTFSEGAIEINDGDIYASGGYAGIEAYQYADIKGGTVTSVSNKWGIIGPTTIGSGIKKISLKKGGNDFEAVRYGTITISDGLAVTTPEGGYCDGKDFYNANGKKITSVVIEPVKGAKSVKGVSLNKKTENVAIGSTTTLKVKFTPSNPTNKGVTWNSSNKKVATVDQNGKVKGVRAGTATITVTTKDGGKTATCKVTVKKPVKVKSIKFNKKEYSVKKGKTVTLKTTFTPKDATNKEVTYKTSDKKIATIDKNGKVKGLKKGEVTITVTTKDGKKKAACKVIVK